MDTHLYILLTLYIVAGFSCQYLAGKFFPGIQTDILLSTRSVCLCDDDNDLEMALACQHAYIPDVSSTSMSEMISKHSDHFTKTCSDGQEGTVASSEMALSLVLDRLTATT